MHPARELHAQQRREYIFVRFAHFNHGRCERDDVQQEFWSHDVVASVLFVDIVGVHTNANLMCWPPRSKVKPTAVDSVIKCISSSDGHAGTVAGADTGTKAV